MKHLKTAALTLLLSQAAYAEQLPKVELEGLFLWGSPATAKALGFTDCKAGSTNYLCTRNKPTYLFGAKATTAEVSIDGKENTGLTPSSKQAPKISDLSHDQLSYRGIRLIYETKERVALEKNLEAEGWLKVDSAKIREYYKSGVYASIRTDRTNVFLQPEAESYIKQKVANLEAKLKENAATESKTDAFIESMKK